MSKKFDKLLPGPQLGYLVVFSSSDWEEMERAYGQKLTDAARRLISLATLLFTLAFPMESSAPKIGGSADVLNDMERLIEQAERLRERLYPSHYWKREYEDQMGPRRPLRWRLIEQLQSIDDDNEGSILRILLIGLIESGPEVVGRAREDNVAREGRSWDAWIVWLTLIMKAFKLSSGIRSEVYRVRKGKDQRKEPSSFVKLVQSLQKIACPHYTGSRTPGGLAKAIGRARHSIKVPENLGAGSIEPDKLEQELLACFGIDRYPLQNQLDPSLLQQAVKIVLEGTRRPGIHPFIAEPLNGPPG
jgi:hypothetical protein